MEMEVIEKNQNTVYMSHSIATNKPLKESFDFIVENLSKVYAEISDGHQFFKPRSGTRIKEGDIIDCTEVAGNQSIKHEYFVNRVIPNQRIQYTSKPSFVKVKLPWKTIDTKSNTYVYYDFESGEYKTTIRITIGVQFGGPLEKFFSVIFGGMRPWKKHCIEEMEGLKRILT